MSQIYMFIFAIVIIVLWALMLGWFNKSVKRKVELAGKTNEFERNKSRIGAITFTFWGVVIIGMVILNWRNMPSGNKFLGIIIIGGGVILLLVGLYKLYKVVKDTRYN